MIGEVVLAVLVYRIFGSRTFAAVMIGYGFSILLMTYLSKIRATLNLLWPIQYFFLVASIATLYLSLNYNMLGNTWYDLDVVLSGRLSTWYWIINYYGIHLFGTDMSSLDKGLDNGYLYLLMYSGIFSLIIYNLIFYFVAKKAWNNQEWMILITMLFYNVYAFFESTPLFGGLCNILLIFAYLVLGKQREKFIPSRKEPRTMIPKIIHYCWFGGNPKPESVKRYIESWHRYCPDYKICEWNESNFDIHENDYCREAYEAKKWAFVADMARLVVLEKYGGIYMDTDVEVVRPFDNLLTYGAFMCFEKKRLCIYWHIGSGKGKSDHRRFPYSL